MKKLIHSKPIIIVSAIILLALIILLYIKSRTNYPVAIMGSLKDSDKSIVMLDMKKKTIIETGINFKLDKNAVGDTVSINKKYLVYTIYTNFRNVENGAFIKNLQNGKVNEIKHHVKPSYIWNIKWIDENTLLYFEKNTLYTLDVNSLKSKAVNFLDTTTKLAAIYYPENKGFIICTSNKSVNNSDFTYNNFESDLYIIDSKGGNKKLLKKFKDYYITGIRLMPDTDNLLIGAVNDPADNQNLFEDLYVYNIKSGSFKLVLKHKNDIASYTYVFPYDKNNFLFQYEYKLYNVNIQTGKIAEFNFKNQNAADFFYSFTGAE